MDESLRGPLSESVEETCEEASVEETCEEARESEQARERRIVPLQRGDLQGSKGTTQIRRKVGDRERKGETYHFWGRQRSR